MLLFALLLDEDICNARFVRALAMLGFDVMTVLDAARNGMADDSQLEFAASQGRVIVTGNESHFAQLQAIWAKEGREHAGIIVCRQQVQSPESRARELFDFASSTPEGAMANAIYHL